MGVMRTIYYRVDNGSDRGAPDYWFEDSEGNDDFEIAELPAGVRFDKSVIDMVEYELETTRDEDNCAGDWYLDIDGRFNNARDVSLEAHWQAIPSMPNHLYYWTRLDLPHDCMDLHAPSIIHRDELENEIMGTRDMAIEWCGYNNVRVCVSNFK